MSAISAAAATATALENAHREIERLTQERDDAEARGEAMFEKLQPALTIAEAEIERLQAALRETRQTCLMIALMRVGRSLLASL